MPRPAAAHACLVPALVPAAAPLGDPRRAASTRLLPAARSSPHTRDLETSRAHARPLRSRLRHASLPPSKRHCLSCAGHRGGSASEAGRPTAQPPPERLRSPPRGGARDCPEATLELACARRTSRGAAAAAAARRGDLRVVCRWLDRSAGGSRRDASRGLDDVVGSCRSLDRVPGREHPRF